MILGDKPLISEVVLSHLVSLVVKVVCDTSSETITRVDHGGSLIEELRLSTLKQDGHGGLCGSGHWCVIPYVHEKDYCIVVCVLQASVELA
jgi:hypothetical protein